MEAGGEKPSWQSAATDEYGIWAASPNKRSQNKESSRRASTKRIFQSTSVAEPSRFLRQAHFSGTQATLPFLRSVPAGDALFLYGIK
jgi:hypothetical protein